MILAGGAGRRLRTGPAEEETSKAAARLAGRALVSYPVEILTAVCDRVAVVCKRDTHLPPDVARTERWNEPDEPRHPLAGIVHALEQASGPVLVCAADMPFVTASACRELIAAATGAGQTSPAGSRSAADAAGRRRAPAATVAEAEAALEPLLALYTPEALAALRAAPDDAPLRTTIEALDPLRVALPASVLRSVNTPEDLDAAALDLHAARA